MQTLVFYVRNSLTSHTRESKYAFGERRDKQD